MIKKFFEKAKNLFFSQTARQTYLTTFGAGINAFLGFVFTIVIARLLSPSDFGVFSVISSLILLLIGFSDLGVSSSAMKFLPKADDKEKKEIIKIIYQVSIISSLCLTFLLSLFSLSFSKIIFRTNNLSFLIKLSSPAILGLTLWSLSFIILYAKKEFLKGVIVDTSVVIFKMIAIILLILCCGLDLKKIILAFSLTPLIAVILGLIFIRPSFSFSLEKKLLRKIFSFSIWVFFAKIAVNFLGQIDNLMLARFADSVSVGIYAAANRMTFIFPVAINGLTVVLMPKFAGFKEIEEAKNFFKKTIFALSFFLIPLIFLYFLTDFLIFWLFGFEYMAASPVFKMLLLRTLFFIAATVPLTTLVYFFGESKTFAILSILQVLILIFCNFIFIPYFKALGPAISGVFSYGIIFFISLLIILLKFKKSKNK